MGAPECFEVLDEEQHATLCELLSLAREAGEWSSEVSQIAVRLAGAIVNLPRERREVCLGVLRESFAAFAAQEESLEPVAYLLLQVTLVIAVKHEGAAVEALVPLMKAAWSELDTAPELTISVLAH
jgi:hypothetical protein